MHLNNLAEQLGRHFRPVDAGQKFRHALSRPFPPWRRLIERGDNRPIGPQGDR
jgi:hypothetical protein